MEAVAIIPIKRFAEAKQRLGDAVPDSDRADLLQAMATDVLDAVGRCKSISATVLVSSEPRIMPLAEGRGLEVVPDPGGLGHSASASLGVRWSNAAQAKCVAMLPGDCPLLDPIELDAALDRMDGSTLTVIPDRHGSGTNGLLIAPPDGIDPAFGPGSCERHLALGRTAGLEARVEQIASMGPDLDTPEDLDHLVSLLAADPQRAPQTAAALNLPGSRP